MAKTLKVPGATLYYETRGSGPLLLLIPGGPTDADIFTGIATLLSDRYHVVTLDPRGNSRSTVDDESAGWQVDQHADDAKRVLQAEGAGPALVFGNSSGGLVGLALAVRHPELVRTVVAHEPPITELLPDRQRYRAEHREIQETLHRDGVGAAMAKFMTMAGLANRPHPEAPPAPSDAAARAGMERMGKNFHRFLGDGLGRIGAHVPDLAALRASPCRIVAAAGEASAGQPAWRASEALASQLRTELVSFPGDHGGFVTDARAFADRLDVVVREHSDRASARGTR